MFCGSKNWIQRDRSVAVVMQHGILTLYYCVVSKCVKIISSHEHNIWNCISCNIVWSRFFALHPLTRPPPSWFIHKPARRRIVLRDDVLPFAAYRKCQTEDFRCEVNGPASGPCLPKSKRCDGYYDCRNHKDEENCGPAMNMSCPLDKFRCLNGQKCIDPKLKCDHQNNCGDNSDEENCSELTY